MITNHTRTGFLVREKNILDSSGQVAIEFILTFIFAIGITFLFINQVLNMTDGFLTHYANYMASRAYLVAEAGNNNEASGYVEATRVATSVFKSYPLEDFDINATFEVTQPASVGGQAIPVFVGTTAFFKKKITSFSTVGGSSQASLLSESFLGKEPTRFSCYSQVCAAVTGVADGCNNPNEMDVTLYDNGC